MTADAAQGVLFTHRNHYLFSDYYLDHRAPELPAWRQDDPGAAFAALGALWQEVKPWIAHANEATTEEGWIRPVLRELGHVYAVQVALQTPGGSKTPDYVLCPDEPARLAEEGRRLYAEFCTTWDEAPLLAWVDAMLAAPDHSDAVHDLLAHLAEQMIEMHKARQAEVKGFLAWLEREIGAPVDSLTGKSWITNYLGDYQKAEQALTYDELLELLRKNRRKIVVDPGKRVFQERLDEEYMGSLAVLNPIKARLAATDRLIDRVVYRLYRLTEEEIRIVERRG